ncbi:MAG: pyruvate/2-oxoglutarate dehydrogenase complex dihydrolipoamide dehydrogenase (E3) component [Ilumatobacter sp.]|jgi:pyruvate/2-oxoglutarate dehydrogenase complex dihydrolipoamide dehydrogenase (E3) component
MWSKYIPSRTVLLVNYAFFMAKIVVAGGGVCGMGAVMILADDGHQVTVVERAADPVPERPRGSVLCVPTPQRFSVRSCVR